MAILKHPLLYVWIVLVVVILWPSNGIALGQPSGSVYPDYEEQNRQAKERDARKWATNLKDYPPREAYEPRCKDDDKRDECLLTWRSARAAEAQARGTLDQAYRARWGFWLLVATFAATAGAAIFARQAAKATQASADIAGKTLLSMQDTAKRQLRAYIGHMPNGAHFESIWVIEEGGWERAKPTGPVKYFDQNHGLTPAKDASLYVRILSGYAGPPAKIDWDLQADPAARKEFLSFIPPQQNIGRIVGTQTQNDTFFLYGFVNYTDIFGDRWQHRFGFQPRPREKAQR